MWRNPLATAVLGVLGGFFAGYLMGEMQVSAHLPNPGGLQDASGPASSSGVQRQRTGLRGDLPAGVTLGFDLEERVRVLEETLARQPRDYESILELAGLRYDLGLLPMAADLYERARGIRDDNPDLLTDLGICYREMDQPKRAVALFDRAAELSARHWQSRYNAAVVRLYDLDDAAGALKEVSHLRALKDSNPGIPDLSGIEAEINRRLQ